MGPTPHALATNPLFPSTFAHPYHTRSPPGLSQQRGKVRAVSDPENEGLIPIPANVSKTRDAKAATDAWLAGEMANPPSNRLPLEPQGRQSASYGRIW
jgi:hypothetical protein